MACQSPGKAGDTIKALNDPTLVSSQGPSLYNFGNQSFINSHYLSAGGQVFTATGYEFIGRHYNNIDEFRHDKIGTPATPKLSPNVDTGSNGPCIGCHMSRPNKNGNHLFLPVSRSTTTIGLVTRHCQRALHKVPRALHDAHPRPRKKTGRRPSLSSRSKR